MMIVLLYIVIVIMAFVFRITISNTIRKEAGVIGTLRASGYTKGELIRHYMTLPVIITLYYPVRSIDRKYSGIHRNEECVCLYVLWKL